MNDNKEVINVFTTGEVQGFNNILFMRYKLNKLHSETYTLFVNSTDGTFLNVWTPSKNVWKLEYKTDFEASYIKELLLKKSKECVTFCDNSTDEKFLGNINEVIKTMNNNKEKESIKTLLESNGFSNLEHIRTDEINKVYLFKGSKIGTNVTQLTIATEPNKLSVYCTAGGLKDNKNINSKECLTLSR
ncbi:hypothetical protein P4679_25730 [Priestia megaterium]|uniref:hypothetical protein n=1 Tax=Priestia megaterium TaxID=1404 RepID=UPI002E1E4C05|nr:hypothetical protein [Priestia megaterium]